MDARWLVVGVGMLACMPLGLAKSPDEVVREYLEAGSRDDLEAARALVEERCHDTPVGRVAPARILGLPVKLSSLTVEPVEVGEERATVRYQAVGSIEQQDATAEFELFGQKTTVQIDDVSAEQIETSGTVDLTRVDGVWKVTCP